jgi:hypothetical protein
MSDLLQGEADYGLKTTVLKTKSNDENAKSGQKTHATKKHNRSSNSLQSRRVQGPNNFTTLKVETSNHSRADQANRQADKTERQGSSKARDKQQTAAEGNRQRAKQQIRNIWAS